MRTLKYYIKSEWKKILLMFLLTFIYSGNFFGQKDKNPIIYITDDYVLALRDSVRNAIERIFKVEVRIDSTLRKDCESFIKCQNNECDNKPTKFSYGSAFCGRKNTYVPLYVPLNEAKESFIKGVLNDRHFQDSVYTYFNVWVDYVKYGEISCLQIYM